jgi:hypothetical protein
MELFLPCLGEYGKDGTAKGRAIDERYNNLKPQEDFYSSHSFV